MDAWLIFPAGCSHCGLGLPGAEVPLVMSSLCLFWHRCSPSVHPVAASAPEAPAILGLPFPPKVSCETLASLKQDFATNYPSELLHEDSGRAPECLLGFAAIFKIAPAGSVHGSSALQSKLVRTLRLLVEFPNLPGSTSRICF